MRGVSATGGGVPSSTWSSRVLVQIVTRRVLLSVGAAVVFMVCVPQAARLLVEPPAGPPEVVNADVPFYPRLPQVASIEGTVVLRISTDGTYAQSIEAVEGPPLLAAAAKRNASTWQFEPHKPTTFDATFRYRLLDVTCRPGCDCRSTERPSISLRLPTQVQVNAERVVLCDPAEKR
jgi:hypothetical protein